MQNYLIICLYADSPDFQCYLKTPVHTNICCLPSVCEPAALWWILSLHWHWMFYFGLIIPYKVYWNESIAGWQVIYCISSRICHLLLLMVNTQVCVSPTTIPWLCNLIINCSYDVLQCGCNTFQWSYCFNFWLCISMCDMYTWSLSFLPAPNTHRKRGEERKKER